MTTKVIPPLGRVDLVDKKEPIYQTPPPFNDHYAFILCRIDITNWKEKLSSLREEMWLDENQDDNVKLIRPAHDAWGVQKIIFTFCDDFLQQIIDLPYSEHEDWKNLLDSVYEAVGVDKSRIVRSLLARMPAGVKIPVHHDTGYWVKHTHRCHLPLETNDNVEFWVGPTEEEIKLVRKEA
jgi:hypothetical protein